jgi:hypothetical protein
MDLWHQEVGSSDLTENMLHFLPGSASPIGKQVLDGGGHRGNDGKKIDILPSQPSQPRPPEKCDNTMIACFDP